ncbi:MAG TPA: hypothetical protein VFF52_28470 [Isosphaeraceae bacterium]|nr:hypothetical protein [Isosphaeraceae bacterium]
MGMLGEEPEVNTVKDVALPDHAREPSPRFVPCNDATGRVLPITPEEQARNARAIAAFVERMLAMPDEDPPGAWEDAMRDLDAQRPHRKLFEGLC